VRSRAFHDAAGASGPVGRVSGVASAGAATRYRRGINRRAGTFRVAEHFTHEHGEERYVRSVRSKPMQEKEINLFRSVKIVQLSSRAFQRISRSSRII